MLKKKRLIGLVPLVVAAFAVVPSGAAALGQCRVLTYNTKQTFGTECYNPPGVKTPQNLRENKDGSATTPNSENFGTNGLAVNTKGAMRINLTIAGAKFRNTLPQGYGFVGLKVNENPESSTTVCRTATGTIPWVDFSNFSPGAVFDTTNSWTFAIKSQNSGCPAAERGKVTISNVSLDFETLGISESPIVATGSLTGVYEEPGLNCPAGGIKFNTGNQTGITTEPKSTAFEIDNGTNSTAAFICFVAANNYLFPSSAPTWALTEGTGIWGN